MTNGSKVERMQELLRSMTDEAPVCEACAVERDIARQKWIDDARAMMDADGIEAGR